MTDDVLFLFHCIVRHCYLYVIICVCNVSVELFCSVTNKIICSISVNTLIRDGKVVRPILGIGFLESKQARALGIGRGVLVLEVPPDSPAAKAGLKGTKRTETGLVEIGDIIVKVGDVVIETEANLFQSLEKYKPGDFVDVKVLRIDAVDDQLKQKELTLNIELQSSEVLERGRYFLKQQEN